MCESVRMRERLQTLTIHHVSVHSPETASSARGTGSFFRKRLHEKEFPDTQDLVD